VEVSHSTIYAGQLTIVMSHANATNLCDASQRLCLGWQWSEEQLASEQRPWLYLRHCVPSQHLENSQFLRLDLSDKLHHRALPSEGSIPKIWYGLSRGSLQDKITTPARDTLNPLAMSRRRCGAW
jgi:hypothetical protein